MVNYTLLILKPSKVPIIYSFLYLSLITLTFQRYKSETVTPSLLWPTRTGKENRTRAPFWCKGFGGDFDSDILTHTGYHAPTLSTYGEGSELVLSGNPCETERKGGQGRGRLEYTRLSMFYRFGVTGTRGAAVWLEITCRCLSFFYKNGDSKTLIKHWHNIRSDRTGFVDQILSQNWN